MSFGYIKLHRQLKDHALWLSEKFTDGQAWVDLLMLANHKKGIIKVRGIRLDIEPGQCGYSVITLAKRWKWSRGKVIRFLDFLKQQNMINVIQQKNCVSTIISICNYNQFQFGETANDAPNKTGNDTANRQQTDTNKNEKNEKNISTSEFDHFWNTYNKKVGREKCLKEWKKISESNIKLILDHVPRYVDSTPDIQYRKDPLTYLKGKHWSDEIICRGISPISSNKTIDGKIKLAV